MSSWELLPLLSCVSINVKVRDPAPGRNPLSLLPGTYPLSWNPAPSTSCRPLLVVCRSLKLESWVLSQVASLLRWPTKPRLPGALWVNWERDQEQSACGFPPAGRNNVLGGFLPGCHLQNGRLAVYLLFLMESWGGEFWTLWRIWWICGPSQKFVHVPQFHPCGSRVFTGPWTQSTCLRFMLCFTSVHSAARILKMGKMEKNLRI